MIKERPYRPASYDFSCDDYKARFQQQAKKEGMTKHQTEQLAINVWLNIDVEREKLLNEIEEKQKRLVELDYIRIKKTLLFWET